MNKLLLAAALAFAPAAAFAQATPAPDTAPAAPAAQALPDADPALWVVRDADTTIYLFGTIHMLDGRPDAVHGEALIAALRALRAIGLDREARAIAVATALALDL